MTPFKTFIQSAHDLFRWILRICLVPFIGALEAISKASQKLADELSKV
jgi:hypothetical protein